MQTLCPDCAAGPQGAYGHAALDVVPRKQVGDAERRFILQCRNCSSRWVREFSREGPTWKMLE